MGEGSAAGPVRGAAAGGDGAEHSAVGVTNKPTARVLALMRFRRRVERLHALGPAPLACFIREVGRDCPGARPFLAARLQQYATIDPELVAQLGGREFVRIGLVVVPPDGSA